MSETLPLFPLGTVLFPGLVLPLHIFEDRYKQLVRDLLDGQEPRRFGVIAIRVGRETGIGGVSALHEVGCTATVREVAEADDGQYDIVTVGTDRFRLRSLEDSRPYLTGEIELLDEPLGDEAPRRWRPPRSSAGSARTSTCWPTGDRPRSASLTCRTSR